MRNINLVIFTSALLLFSFTGCGYSKAVTPGESKGFVTRRSEGSEGIVTKITPFMYAWNATDFPEIRQALRDGGHYSLYVSPVGLHYLELSGKSKSLRDDVQKLAEYFHEQIIQEIKDYQKGSLQVTIVDRREDADLALEIELTEVGFGSPLLYVGAWVTPIPGVATAYDASHTSVLAFEGRIIDPKTEKIWTEVYDRKIPKIRPFDARKAVSKFSPLRDISNDWSVEIARGVSARADKDVVEGTYAFSLIPW